MPPFWLRLAYAAEFLISVPAVFTLWAQVGGQGHLDLMAWPWKLGLGLGMCIAIVRFTASVVQQERAVNRRSVLWSIAILILAASMGWITYYYHVHEPTDEGDPEEGTPAALIEPAIRRPA